jgi:hypothetical protein
MIFRARRRAHCRAMIDDMVRVRATHSPAPTDPNSLEAKMEVVPHGGPTPTGVLKRTTMANALIVAAIVALAIASLVQSNVPATAQTAPSAATVPLYIPRDSGEVSRFAFGYVEFDWDPAAGVPGFGSWPLGTPQQ